MSLRKRYEKRQEEKKKRIDVICNEFIESLYPELEKIADENCSFSITNDNLDRKQRDLFFKLRIEYGCYDCGEVEVEYKSDKFTIGWYDDGSHTELTLQW